MIYIILSDYRGIIEYQWYTNFILLNTQKQTSNRLGFGDIIYLIPNRVKAVQGGIKEAKFSIVTSHSYKAENGKLNTSTVCHSIILWRGLVSFVEKYVQKGSILYVEGKLKIRCNEVKEGIKKYITEIIAEKLN